MEDVDDRHIMEEEDHGWNEKADKMFSADLNGWQKNQLNHLETPEKEDCSFEAGSIS